MNTERRIFCDTCSIWTGARNVHSSRLGTPEFGGRVSCELTSVYTSPYGLPCHRLNFCSTTTQEAGLVGVLGPPDICFCTSCTVPPASNLRRHYLWIPHIFSVVQYHFKITLCCSIAKFSAPFSLQPVYSIS